MFMGLGPVTACSNDSDFVWEFGKLPFGLFPGLGKITKKTQNWEDKDHF